MIVITLCVKQSVGFAPLRLSIRSPRGSLQNCTPQEVDKPSFCSYNPPLQTGLQLGSKNKGCRISTPHLLRLFCGEYWIRTSGYLTISAV